MLYGNRYLSESTNSLVILESEIENSIRIFENTNISLLNEGTIGNFIDNVIDDIKRFFKKVWNTIISIINKIVDLAKKISFRLKNGKLKDGEVEFYDYNFQDAVQYYKEFSEESRLLASELMFNSDSNNIEEASKKVDKFIDDIKSSYKKEKITQEIVNKINNTVNGITQKDIENAYNSMKETVKELDKYTVKIKKFDDDEMYKIGKSLKHTYSNIKDLFHKVMELYKVINKGVAKNISALARCTSGSNSSSESESK